MPYTDDAHASLNFCIYLATLPDSLPIDIKGFPVGVGFQILHTMSIMTGGHYFTVHRSKLASDAFLKSMSNHEKVKEFDARTARFNPTPAQRREGLRIYREWAGRV